MKKSGYEQFFSEVRKQRSENGNTQSARASAIRSSKVSSSRKRSASALRDPFPGMKRKVQVPWLAVGLFGLGFAVSVALFLKPDFLSTFAPSVKLTVFGQARAAQPAQPAKTSPSTGSNAAKNSPSPSAPVTPDGLQGSQLTPEEMKIFSQLSERKHELDLRQAELDKLEAELQKQESKLNAKIQELTQLRAEIAQTLKGRVNLDQKKIDKLVAFYSNMDPKQAAKIIASLNDNLAVETLVNMKKKVAAKIMDDLDPKKAETLSEKIAGYQQ